MKKLIDWKMNARAAAKAAAVSMVGVPMLGIVANYIPNKGTFIKDNSNLADRFYTAYTINADPARSVYSSYEMQESAAPKDGVEQYVDADGNVHDQAWVKHEDGAATMYSTEEYSVTPMVVYPMHIIVAGLAFRYFRRRESEKKYMSGRSQNVR